MDSAWKFADSPQTVVVTLERILRGDSSVLLVTHDAEDGGWQFLDGEHVFEEDGTTVRMGEMVQFDPSLFELADLPAGWFAWRAAGDRCWQRGQGEPGSTLGTASIDSRCLSQPARNIEIKARVDAPDRLQAELEALSDTAVEILNQRDVFFKVSAGRLKLRILGDGVGELIHYERPNQDGPRVSQYLIASTSHPQALMSILSRILPAMGTVQKERRLYRIGQTRVHLDHVAGLGAFVELEVVLGPHQSEEEGTAIAENLMGRLAISREDLVARAYIDLLLEST